MSGKCTPNYNIRCHVTSCANHCGQEEYCALDCICVGTHESDPKVQECTDCQSFIKK
ncbi:MAG: DUF1540 domain-containing protein [Clostridiales bacterium]|nr:MAG: DUF1540 domain-containing protein [Clostridiales bacterium]